MFILTNCCWQPLMLLGSFAKGRQVNQTALKWKSSGIRNVRNTIIHNDKTDWRMECQEIKCDTDQWHSAELMSLSSLSRNDGSDMTWSWYRFHLPDFNTKNWQKLKNNEGKTYPLHRCRMRNTDTHYRRILRIKSKFLEEHLR